MTSASWIAQMSKGSWETVWALIDGNMTTGSFGPLVDRFTPESAAESMGNPARIDPRLSLALFTFVGLILFVKYPCVDNQSRVAFLTITWCIFLLWSPGWSPQWILYLIPLIFLSMPDRTGILLVVILTLVNLLEWPLLLSRGDIWGLWLTVPLRTFLIILTLILLLKVRPGRQSSEGAS